LKPPNAKKEKKEDSYDFKRRGPFQGRCSEKIDLLLSSGVVSFESGGKFGSNEKRNGKMDTAEKSAFKSLSPSAGEEWIRGTVNKFSVGAGIEEFRKDIEP